MKIQVVRCDGNIETLNLSGTVKISEASSGGQASLTIESTGTSHFFRQEDGAYDGWGMEVGEWGTPLQEHDMASFIEAVERDRKIHRPPKSGPLMK